MKRKGARAASAREQRFVVKRKGARAASTREQRGKKIITNDE